MQRLSDIIEIYQASMKTMADRHAAERESERKELERNICHKLNIGFGSAVRIVTHDKTFHEYNGQIGVYQGLKIHGNHVLDVLIIPGVETEVTVNVKYIVPEKMLKKC